MTLCLCVYGCVCVSDKYVFCCCYFTPDHFNGRCVHMILKVLSDGIQKDANIIYCVILGLI